MAERSAAVLDAGRGQALADVVIAGVSCLKELPGRRGVVVQESYLRVVSRPAELFAQGAAILKSTAFVPGLGSKLLWNDDNAICARVIDAVSRFNDNPDRSEEHTSELQSPCNLVCSLLL